MCTARRSISRRSLKRFGNGLRVATRTAANNGRQWSGGARAGRREALSSKESSIEFFAHDGILALLFAAILVAMFAPPAFAAETRLTLEACRGADAKKRVITPNGGHENLFACMTSSQIAAAQWLSQNKPPDWTIKRISCSVPDIAFLLSSSSGPRWKSRRPAGVSAVGSAAGGGPLKIEAREKDQHQWRAPKRKPGKEPGSNPKTHAGPLAQETFCSAVAELEADRIKRRLKKTFGRRRAQPRPFLRNT